MIQSKTPDIQEIEANVKAVLKGLSICLIDDSRAFCAGVRELLAPYSVNLHIFQDPAVAFPKLSEVAPDIIITDFEMGEIGGMEVIKTLRANPVYNSRPGKTPAAAELT